MIKIVLFGEDVFSVAVCEALIQAGFSIPLVICPLYKKSVHHHLQAFTKQNNISFLLETDVNSDKVKNILMDIQPDIILSVHLRKILKKEIFSITKIAAINVHPSLLPKYRGLSPQHQAILHGDKESAVTVHIIEEEVDKGHIVVQEIIPINETDYIHDYQLKMLTVYKRLLPQAIYKLNDKSFIPEKQSELNASYFGQPKEKDRELDFTKSKKTAYNLIRAFSLPYAGAHYNGYTIWRAAKVEDEKKYPDSFYQNGIHTIDDETILLKFNDGFLISDDFEIK